MDDLDKGRRLRVHWPDDDDAGRRRLSFVGRAAGWLMLVLAAGLGAGVVGVALVWLAKRV